jgi:hypothetical protein
MNPMNPETIAKTHRGLQAASMTLWAAAAELSRTASAIRATVADQARRSPARRMARLAQGGRDLDGDHDGNLVETREPRCPHCQSVRIMRLEKREIVEGRVRTDCQCLVCEKAFVYSRKTVTQLAREELVRESNERPPRDPEK